MVKGFKVTAFRAGLLALTALASTAPALAQERGNWGGRAGVERATGGERGGGWQRGGSTGGGQIGGGENRGWRNNGAAPTPPTVQAGGQGDSRGWRGDSNRQWQGGTARIDATPTPRVEGDAGSNRYGRAPGGGNWRNGDANRGDQNRWNDNRRQGDWNRNADNRGGNGYSNGSVNRAYGNPNDGSRNYARPYANGWQSGNGRINANDRWRDQNRWNRDWRRDNRYDWSSYRQYNRNAYRLPAYRAPYGWNGGYSRYSIGVYLGSSLFGSNYWIDDPYSYRLPAAYGTLRWVRYYDDALLVDIRDGYVVDVIHDFFW